jgi:pullulanase
VNEYVKSLITIRRAHPAFRMKSADLIRKNLVFMETSPGLVAYTLNGKAVGDKWNKIVVIFNGSPAPSAINLPAGSWKLGLASYRGNVVADGELTLPAFSSVIMYQ